MVHRCPLLVCAVFRQCAVNKVGVVAEMNAVLALGLTA